MKRRTLHTLLALATATSFVACDKKAADQPSPPPAANSTAPSTATAPVVPAPVAPAPAKVTEAVKSAMKEAPQIAAAPVNVAAIRETYGIVAMLPKDVEGFGVNYRMHDLWVKLSNSNWSKTLINMPALKNEPKFQEFLAQWNSPQAAQAKEIIESILGGEFAAVHSAGFTEKFMPWMDVLVQFQQMNFQRGFMTAMSGGQPPDSQKLFRDAMPDLVPVLVKCDIPPMFFAYKAAKSKEQIDAGLGMAVAMLGMKPTPGLAAGRFKLADKYDFQNITLDVGKLMEMAEEMIRAQLAEVLGDEGKAKQAVEALKKKHIEIAWGWVGDYLILSIGSDHAHVKFAASDADSALSLPAVALRAAEYAGKKPLSLGYASAAMQEKIHGSVEFADKFKKLSDELGGLLKPEHIAAMQADVKKFEAKVQALHHAKFDPLITVSFWDSGIRGEIFGGAQQTALDASKPLTFASLLTKSAFIFTDDRSNATNDGKVADLIEDASSTLWSWYEKYGRTMVPENERSGATMVEMMAVPMVKDLWASSRKLGKALGDESAFILDLNGSMPNIPGLPPMLAEGKVPRIAWVAELKDRAGVSAAWEGFSKVIKQLSQFAPGAVPEPTMKKDGDVEIHFIELPIPTDDLLPHIAISKDRWIISTSPSLSKEITSKSPATGGAPLGGEWRMQIPAACDLAEAWLRVVDKNPALFFHGSTSDVHEYTQLRPTFGELLKLGRSIQSIEARVFTEGSATRMSAWLKLEDVK